MSNTLAIATVTATFQRILQQALNNASVGGVSGADVKMVRPGTPGNAGLTRGVTLYLYQVTPNAAGRNADLPTRGADGKLVQRPRVALELHYLLSFFGDDGTLEPQRMAGIVLATMHARPVLTPDAIRDTVSDLTFSQVLNGSDLADAIELVRFTPISFTLEELSKVWSVFFQTAHTLSIAYQASVVFVETDDRPKAVLPVRDRRFFTGSVRQPVLTALQPQILTDAEKLTLIGRALLSDVTRVRFGELAPVAPDQVADDRIEVGIPSGLRAGLGTVSVVHEEVMVTNKGETKTVPIASNVAAFMLVPRVVLDPLAPPISVKQGAALPLKVSPKVGPGQSITLLLGDTIVPGAALFVVFEALLMFGRIVKNGAR